jgi:predicted transposase/invertase (TIGR01784 family)
MGLLQLIGLKDTEAPDRAKAILAQTYEQTPDAVERRRVLEWIVTVFVYKFTTLSREEIQAMLGVTKELRETRFYQDIREEGLAEGLAEGKAEGKQEGKAEVLMQTIPLLLQAGVSVQAIADQLNITIAQVQAFSKTPEL